MKETTPSITVSYVETISDEIIAPFRETVEDPRLNLCVEARPEEGPFVGLAWLVPTAVVIFFGRSYFDSFLKEAGKEHYHLLKRGLSSFWKTLFGKNRRILRIPTKRIG